MFDENYKKGEALSTSRVRYFANRVMGPTIACLVCFIVLFVSVRGFVEGAVKSFAKINLANNTSAEEIAIAAS